MVKITMIHKDTNKRIIIIALIVVIVLVVGFIIGLLAWLGRSWLGRPDGLTAIFTVFAGVGTVGAVIVALFDIGNERKRAQEDRVEAQRRFEESQKQTQDALEEGRRQFLEAQYAANRPILIPNEWSPSRFSGNPPISILWNEREQPSIKVDNEGTGIATNVWGVLIPLNINSNAHYLYYSQVRTPIPAKDSGRLQLIRNEAILNGSDKIVSRRDSANSCTLGIETASAHEENLDQRDKIEGNIARLTLTYHDIFGRKHASIFDYTNMGNWVCVSFLLDIEYDLVQLEKGKGGLLKESPPPSVKYSNRIY